MNWFEPGRMILSACEPGRSSSPARVFISIRIGQSSFTVSGVLVHIILTNIDRYIDRPSLKLTPVNIASILKRCSVYENGRSADLNIARE